MGIANSLMVGGINRLDLEGSFWLDRKRSFIESQGMLFRNACLHPQCSEQAKVPAILF
jgi:hypothetical protein